MSGLEYSLLFQSPFSGFGFLFQSCALLDAQGTMKAFCLNVEA